MTGMEDNYEHWSLELRQELCLATEREYGLTQDNSKFLLFLWNGLEEAPELVLQKD